ncbi:uncharacterized protein TNIN_368341 [Trichonephila inaurata madagascariensis]|uniref:Gustatory receptor n=1 Tax=Trichonephila inaurata madagascariensis TaxID=2747483 RepID=A0A8X6JXM1_9ARAC|nr:uncharacterized protein TNIN_368341 [Trichonephila inaurata madagascariensis]
MSEKMPEKMYDNNENCFLREFRLFFILLRVFGIEMPGHSSQTKEIMEDKKMKLIPCFHAFLRCILILILCLATINAILWLIILPRGSKEIASTFLTLSVELFYVLIFRRRQAIMRITERLRKIWNTLKPRYNVIRMEREKWMYTFYFIFIQVLFVIWSIMFSSAVHMRAENLQKFFEGLKFPSYLSFFLSWVILITELLFSFITKLIFSAFVIYYSLICRVIRLLFGHLLDVLRRPMFIQELRNLLENYEKITKSMRKVDKEFSLPAFITIITSMIGLFWGGYRLAFRQHMSNEYLISLVCSVSCYLTFQLLIMISASMANEMEKKARSSIKCLKCRVSRDLRETKFKAVCTKESSLTLWKIYVLDRSLLITSFGTLLTYGILIGTLGEEG